MYISEFWCGVGATIIFEIGAIIIISLFTSRKGKKQ